LLGGDKEQRLEADGGEQIERHLPLLYSGATEEEEKRRGSNHTRRNDWLQVHDEVQGQLYHFYEEWLQMSFKSVAGRSFAKPD